jgi:hypothetical protein
VGVSETVLAAMIGAAATVGTAMFQLVSNWRAQTGDRRAVKRGGFRSLMMLLAIMLACVVAGYAFSEYRAQSVRDETHALRADLQQQVQTLSASTARLEQLQLHAQALADTQARTADERRRGQEGVEGLVHVPACKGTQTASGQDRAACLEADAIHIAVCSVIPAKAQVSEVLLFTRPEDSQQAWADSKASAGQDIGGARFFDGSFERPHTETTKELCFNFANWGGDKARVARVVVRYTL